MSLVVIILTLSVSAANVILSNVEILIIKTCKKKALKNHTKKRC